MSDWPNNTGLIAFLWLLAIAAIVSTTLLIMGNLVK